MKTETAILCGALLFSGIGAGHKMKTGRAMVPRLPPVLVG
jgi:hypothetical protein